MAQEPTEIEITTIGRRTGQRHSHPVWFVREGDATYLLPVGGSGSQWYRNLRHNPSIQLGSAATKAKLITDRRKVDEVVADFREKYGDANVTRYYPGVDVAVEVRGI